MSEPGVTGAEETRIGPPHEQASGRPLPVTMVARAGRRPRRLGAHTPPTTEARPLTLVAFESRQLRRSVVTVLALITLWIVALDVFTAIGHFLFILMLSWLFAIAMEPAILWLTARGMRRGSATGLVGTFVVLIVLGIGALFGNLFFTQLAQLVTSLPAIVNQSVEWTNVHLHLHLDPSTVVQKLQLSPSQVGSWGTELAGGVVGVVSQLFTLLLELFTFVVFGFYIAADGPRIRRAIGRWLPPQRQEVFVTVWDIAAQKTGGYVVSKIVLAALSAAFHAVFFYAIGVPFPLPLALLVGITAQFIPVVGTYIGILVPLLFVVFTNPLKAVWIVIFATIYQQIENYLFTPQVSKRTMDVNSGIALAAVFVGAAIWGPIGALIGIPLAAAVVAVVGTYGHRYELVPELAAPELEDEDDTVDDSDDSIDDTDVEDADTSESADTRKGEAARDRGKAAAAVGDERVREPNVPSDDTAPVLSGPLAPGPDDHQSAGEPTSPDAAPSRGRP